MAWARISQWFFYIVLLAAAPLAAADRPRAYVLDHKDQWTGAAHAAELLKQAGCDVAPLPLDRSPAELDNADLIFLASFSSEHPGYGDYMQRHGEALRRWLEAGNVLVQMTQADQVEKAPLFLPEKLAAERSDRDFSQAQVLASEHPLLAGIAAGQPTLQTDATSTIWEAFSDQDGFEVILAGDKHARFPALMVAACGKGRIVLCASAWDKNVPRDGSAEDAFADRRAAFNKRFFENVAAYALAVRDGEAPPVEATPSPRDAAEYDEDSWSLVLLPDTQVYSLRYPGMFTMQTGWILQNRERIDIRYVLHLGDIVNDNTPREWRRARDAMSVLDGKVPYALAAGNHDYGPGGNATTRETLLNDYFSADAMQKWPTFGGVMEEGKLDNSYHLFEAGGRKWIVISLEWAPRDDTVAWANRIMGQHSDRTGILITHAYMNNNDRRYDHTDKEHSQRYNPHQYKTPGGKNDGQQLWDKLVRKHNFALVFNGHVLGDGTGYLASENDHGQMVHQMLSNYQMRDLGGEGYLRVLEFLADGKTVRVKSYSPLYDRFLLEEDQHFELELSPPARQ